MRADANHLRNRFIAALAGTGLVALCCFTPVLVLLLAGLGLSVLTPYLDYVLLPALAIMIFVALRTYLKWHRAE